MNNHHKSEDSIHNPEDIESQMNEIRRQISTIKTTQISEHKKQTFSNGINYKINRSPTQSHQSTKGLTFYKQRVSVQNFLQRPDGFIAISYHILVSCLILTCMVLTVLSTISGFKKRAIDGLIVIDTFIVAFFSAEFMTRLWSSSCICHYRGFRGKLRFFRSPFRIIDMFVIITSAAVLCFSIKSELIITCLKGIKFLQVFQLIRLENRFRPWTVMGSVVWAQREHLAITAYMGVLVLLFISLILFFIEKDNNSDFNNLGSSLWWGVITLCTIGYGDMYPKTPTGKLISCICSIIGVSIFALPAGILGTGLALKIEEQQRQRQLSKRQTPAAKLIQSVWRYYATIKHSKSLVIWRSFHKSKFKFYGLSVNEINAIRFILLVKYLIAKRDFSKASKPYDIKDVLEQYAAGHIDILTRVKDMDFKLNYIQVIANKGLQTQNELNYILRARLSQFEDLLKDAEIRLNQLMKVQFENKLSIKIVLDHMSSNRSNHIKVGIKSESKRRRMSF